MFKLDDKVKVKDIDSVGTIVGKGSQNYSWIVLFDEPPFDNLMDRQSEWKAMVFHESGLVRLYLGKNHGIKVEEVKEDSWSDWDWKALYATKEELIDWSWLDCGV